MIDPLTLVALRRLTQELRAGDVDPEVSQLAQLVALAVEGMQEMLREQLDWTERMVLLAELQTAQVGALRHELRRATERWDGERDPAGEPRRDDPATGL